MVNQIVEELGLREKVVDGKARYLFGQSEYDEKPVKGCSKSKSSRLNEMIIMCLGKLKEPTMLKKKSTKKYVYILKTDFLFSNIEARKKRNHINLTLTLKKCSNSNLEVSLCK